MRARKIFGGCILLLMIGGAVYWTLSASTSRTIRLADGSEVTFKGFHTGRVHYAPGNFFQEAFRLLPESATRGFGWLPKPVLRSTNEIAVAWFHWRPVPNQVEYYIEDERGVAHQDGRWFIIKTQDGELHGVQFDVFPRRHKLVLVRAQPVSLPTRSRQAPAEFHIHHRPRRKYPEWPAEPLPISRMQDGIDFQLARLEVSASEDEATAAFRVLKDGAPTHDWFIEKVHTWDATGNYAKCSSWRIESTPEHQAIVRYRWPLFTGETWKLRVEFSRKAGAFFEPAELWELPPLPITSNAAEAEPLTKRIQDTLITVTPLRRQNDVSAEFSANAAPVKEGWKLTVVRATDQDGNSLRADRIRWNLAGGYVFRIELRESSETVALVLACHQSHFAEYYARPKLVEPAKGNGGAAEEPGKGAVEVNGKALSLPLRKTGTYPK